MNAATPISAKNLNRFELPGHFLTIQSCAILLAKHFRELQSALTAAQV
jgi:hypothetical protein